MCQICAALNPHLSACDYKGLITDTGTGAGNE